MILLGLDDFGLDVNNLGKTCYNRIFNVKIYLKYLPGSDNLNYLTFKERRLLICKFLREGLKNIKTNQDFISSNLIGTRIKPRGLEAQVTFDQLMSLKTNQYIKDVHIESITGFDKIELKKVPTFFSVIGLFGCFVEGYDYSNSIQVTEERILLLKALDFKEAEDKALKEFKEYTEGQYLNDRYRYVQWKFIEIIDIYETSESEINPEGTEVYSIWRNRKIKNTENIGAIGKFS